MDTSSFFISNLDDIYENDNIEIFVNIKDINRTKKKILRTKLKYLLNVRDINEVLPILKAHFKKSFNWNCEAGQ